MIRTRTAVILIFLLITSLFMVMAIYSVTAGQDSIQQSVGQSSVLLAQDMARFVEFGITVKIDDILDYSKLSVVQNALVKSNQEFDELEDMQAYITQQDNDWKSVTSETITPFMQSLISNEVAQGIQKNSVEKINPRTGHSAFAEVFLTNVYGATIAQSGKISDYRQDDEDWWQKAKANGISVGKTEYDESAKTDVIPIGIRITDENGNFVGVLKAALSVRSIIREAEIFTQPDSSTRVNIITEQGNLVYSSTAFRFHEDISDQNFFNKLQASPQEGFFVNEGEFKTELVAYARPHNLSVLGEQDWIFVIKHQIGEVGILSSMLTLRNDMILASVVIIGLATGLGIIFSRSFSSQFTKLTYLAKEIGKENFDAKVNLKGKGEMAQLVNSMHKMGTALKNAKKSKDVVAQQEMEMEKKIEKEKDEFVAMISHELKNPLTPIKIYASSLKRQKFLGELNKKQIDAVEGIYFNTHRLERLIGDLLDAQKLELGKIKFENQWIVVEEFMTMITKNLKSQTEQKGGQLINHTNEEIIMKSDTARLSQVFSNLINNSIDFIPKNKGKIEINAQNKKDKVLFSVKDNGIGIAKEKQKDLFKKFYQADTSVTRKHGGTGLGLAICKGIVEGLGGKIWVESEVGKGTNVYFTISRGTLDEDIDNR